MSVCARARARVCSVVCIAIIVLNSEIFFNKNIRKFFIVKIWNNIILYICDIPSSINRFFA